MTHIYKLIFGLAMLFWTASSAYASDQTSPISLSEVLTLAKITADPSVESYLAKSDMQRDLSIAASQLPDPKIRFGISNLAVDSFSLTQEPMTSLQLGIHQSFQSSLKRKLAGQEGLEKSKASVFAAKNREKEITRTIKKLYARLVFSHALEDLISQKKNILQRSIQSYENRLRNADSKLPISLEIRAELALLDDKFMEVMQGRQQVQAYLSRYIGGPHASRSPNDDYNVFGLPMPLKMIEQGLRDHPALMIDAAMIKANDHSIKLAKENYKPDWGIDLGYANRGAGRADMATAMVTMNVPLFTKKRQDKKLSAAKRAKQSAILTQRSRELEMMKAVRAHFALWQQSEERIDLYNKIIIARTQATTHAYENAFSHGRGDFSQFIRSHLSELNALINLEQIKFQRATATIELNYYAADSEGADK